MCQGGGGAGPRAGPGEGIGAEDGLQGPWLVPGRALHIDPRRPKELQAGWQTGCWVRYTDLGPASCSAGGPGPEEGPGPEPTDPRTPPPPPRRRSPGRCSGSGSPRRGSPCPPRGPPRAHSSIRRVGDGHCWGGHGCGIWPTARVRACPAASVHPPGPCVPSQSVVCRGSVRSWAVPSEPPATRIPDKSLIGVPAHPRTDGVTRGQAGPWVGRCPVHVRFSLCGGGRGAGAADDGSGEVRALPPHSYHHTHPHPPPRPVGEAGGGSARRWLLLGALRSLLGGRKSDINTNQSGGAHRARQS